MRALTRTLVSVTAAAGIAAGTLAGAGTAFADSAQAQQQAVSTEAAPLAVNNLGLTTAEAKKVQQWLKAHWNYTGTIDGQLGTNSWKAFQRCLKAYWGYTGKIDGIVGEGTIKALQRLLKDSWGYTGAIDGKAGSGTKKAFKRFANGV
ncbi:peptidoglycan-binding domain-containing protein [Streptomyces glaucus]|uniref:Lysin n=1 Tax=Streptomyces glaucus TaxID=284029 RepID=A0ABN3J7L6_9ACTN